MVDFQRLHFEAGKESEFFEEKVIEVRYDPCRSADIALVAGGSRKRWIIATENMQVGDVIKTSRTIGRMADSQTGDRAVSVFQSALQPIVADCTEDIVLFWHPTAAMARNPDLRCTVPKQHPLETENQIYHPTNRQKEDWRQRSHRSADIALVAGGSRKRWIIATENMQVGDVIKTSRTIGRMAVSANEGDSYPLGALPIGSLFNNLEIYPGKGAQYVRAAGTCGVLLRKVNGTAIVQLPSKRQIQVLETCMATVGRVSNVDHNKRIIGKAGRNRWLGIRPSSGLWQRKGGWAGRKIKPIPPMKSYVNLPSAAAAAGTTS
ncbi:39S ribosomal protein L2, mitochondrial [Acipenser ruthenus]|uniref:39S ribosomal protein L2, mitochondrial n=1 Tax=Acipenser ruthenus TaxID=7906 RepID=A0A444UCU0_ACIRT|nr:39S ribosomal protein L2, mitochondrial [Acipenser ruthenus]